MAAAFSGGAGTMRAGGQLALVAVGLPAGGDVVCGAAGAKVGGREMQVPLASPRLWGVLSECCRAFPEVAAQRGGLLHDPVVLCCIRRQGFFLGTGSLRS